MNLVSNSILLVQRKNSLNKKPTSRQNGLPCLTRSVELRLVQQAHTGSNKPLQIIHFAPELQPQPLLFCSHRKRGDVRDSPFFRARNMALNTFFAPFSFLYFFSSSKFWQWQQLNYYLIGARSSVWREIQNFNGKSPNVKCNNHECRNSVSPQPFETKPCAKCHCQLRN